MPVLWIVETYWPQSRRLLAWPGRKITGEMKSFSSERNQVVEPGQLILYNPLLHLSLVYFDTDQYKLSR